VGTPPGRYWLEVGWYRFEDGQPIWLPWATGERLHLGDVEITEPADWRALDPPSTAYTAGAAIGDGVKLLGFDAGSLEGRPGDELNLELVWQAQEDLPQPGLVVLQLTDESGILLAEAVSSPVEGLVPFAGMGAGQTLRDPWALQLPSSLQPGVYNVLVGRRAPDGSWLPVQRGPVPLGSAYPLATVHVQGRDVQRTPPDTQHPISARFGKYISLLGYDLALDGWAVGSAYEEATEVKLSLHWQVLAPMEARYKIFVHLVGDGGPSDIVAQADVYPHLPTSGWIEGEYLSDDLEFRMPVDLGPGSYSLLLGLYEPDTGIRLPVFGAEGKPLGDSLVLEQFALE
jgi:hypothetical protein